MGKVVKFPSGAEDYDPKDLRPEDADLISICPMDWEFVPLFESEIKHLAWWGVSGFWHVEDDLNIKLIALFKDKRDAVLYAVGKNERVEPDMPEDTLAELRSAILQTKEPEEPDDTVH